MTFSEKFNSLFRSGKSADAQPHKETTLRFLGELEQEMGEEDARAAADIFARARQNIESSSEASFALAVKRGVYRDMQQCAMVLLRAAAYQQITESRKEQDAAVRTYRFVMHRLTEKGYLTPQQAQDDLKGLDGYLQRKAKAATD